MTARKSALSRLCRKAAMGSTAGVFFLRIHRKATLTIFETTTKKNNQCTSLEIDREKKEEKKLVQSARRKHERPRTALMSCRLPLYFSHLQRAASGGGAGPFTSMPLHCTPQRGGAHDEFSALALHELLSNLLKQNRILFTQNRHLANKRLFQHSP